MFGYVRGGGNITSIEIEGLRSAGRRLSPEYRCDRGPPARYDDLSDTLRPSVHHPLKLPAAILQDPWFLVFALAGDRERDRRGKLIGLIPSWILVTALEHRPEPSFEQRGALGWFSSIKIFLLMHYWLLAVHATSQPVVPRLHEDE